MAEKGLAFFQILIMNMATALGQIAPPMRAHSA